jgi:SOS-response transcriptional repressor LexA
MSTMVQENVFMALGENIRALRERRGWSTHELAARTGTLQSSIWRYERNEVRPRPAVLQRLAGALAVSAGQLEYGSADLSRAVIGRRRIPVLDYIQAGAFTGVAPYFRDEEMQDFLLTDIEYSPDAFALKIHGDSMYPEFEEGDTIIVDPGQRPKPNDFVVAKNGAGEATFKQYKERGILNGKLVIELVPLNDGYPSLRSDQVPIEVVGTMVEHRRYRRIRR